MVREMKITVFNFVLSFRRVTYFQLCMLETQLVCEGLFLLEF